MMYNNNINFKGKELAAMWIVLGIIALIIIGLLLLPVYIIIDSDDNNGLSLKIKILFLTFNLDDGLDSPIIKRFKKDKEKPKSEGKPIKKEEKKKGFLDSVQNIYDIALPIVSEITKLIKRCKITKLELTIICVGDDAAKAAINYGECCAITYPVIGLISSFVKVRNRGKKINISCSYIDNKPTFKLNLVIRFLIGNLLATLIRIVCKEIKRKVKTDN